MGENSVVLAVATGEYATSVPAVIPIEKNPLRLKKLRYTKQGLLMIIYGISNCDSVKKAKNWLDSRHLDYKFHDFRKQGLNEKIINGWLQTVSWDKILNKRSTSWRNLDASIQQTVNETTIVNLLVENPTLIKRPVIDVNDTITIGFNSDAYEGIFN